MLHGPSRSKTVSTFVHPPFQPSITGAVFDAPANGAPRQFAEPLDQRMEAHCMDAPRKDAFPVKPLHSWYFPFKRSFDLVVSVVVLLLSTPLFLLGVVL